MTPLPLQLAGDLPESARVVVVLPDSVRNYMTKFLDDDWMAERQFTDGKPNVDRDTW